MNESFKSAIETFVEERYHAEAFSQFHELVFEEPSRKVLVLVYYYDQEAESDMYELVQALKSYNDSKQIICESVGRFSESRPTLEEIAHVFRRALQEFV